MNGGIPMKLRQRLRSFAVFILFALVWERIIATAATGITRPLTTD